MSDTLTFVGGFALGGAVGVCVTALLVYLWVKPFTTIRDRNENEID